jgi:uncharacterized delta-60 repeat protein
VKPHIGGPVALLATAAALALSSGSALAAAGALDPSFDKDGRSVLPYGGRPAVVLAQPDGKTIVAGTTGKDELAAWRLRADGSLDRGFDGDGAAVVGPGDLAELTAAALQADGKILLAGVSYSVKGPYPVLVRLNANGSPDDSFKTGEEGLVAGTVPDTITAIVVQPDGRILLAGRGGDDFALARLYPTGANDGTAFEPGQFGGYDTPTAAALRRDGTIVLAGTTEELELEDHPPSAVVARYRSDGKLDEHFAGTGKRTLGPGRATGVVAQGDGKVVVERKTADADSRTLVTRLAVNGANDGTFGHGGTAIVDLHGPDAPAGLALQGDGKLLVAASAGYDFAAARLTAGGAPDPSYGLGGASLFGFSGVNRASAAALQRDGRLVIAGSATVGSTDRVAVARLLADPPPTPVVRDRVAPVVSDLAASARRVQFAISEPADVRVVVKRRRAGVVRRLSLAGRPAGPTSVRLRVRKSGRYRVTVTATDRAGNRSLPRRASFRISHH